AETTDRAGRGDGRPEGPRHRLGVVPAGSWPKDRATRVAIGVRRAVVGERRRRTEHLDARLVPAALSCWVTTLLVIRCGWPIGVLLAAAASVLAVGCWAVASGRRGGIVLGAVRRRSVPSAGGVRGVVGRHRTRAGLTRVCRGVPRPRNGRAGLVRRGGGPRVAAIVLLATAAVTAGFALATSWRAHQVDTHPLRALGEKARVEVVVTPSTDPKPVRGTSFDGEQRWVVYAELERYRRGDAVVRGGG